MSHRNEVRALGTVMGHPDDYHMAWSQVNRAGNDFSGEGAMLDFAPTSVSAPTVSQSIDGSGYPVVSWTGVSGILYYNVFHRYTDASCNVTNSGSEYAMSTTSTTFSEATPVTATGIGFNCPYYEYWVRAVTASGYSAASASLFFH